MWIQYGGTAVHAARWQLKCLPRRGRGPHNPPRMGGVAPLVERFEATPPLRARHLVPDFVWVHRNVLAWFQEYFNFA